MTSVVDYNGAPVPMVEGEIELPLGGAVAPSPGRQQRPRTPRPALHQPAPVAAMRTASRRVRASGTRGSVTRARSAAAGREVDRRVRERYRDGDREAVRVVYRTYGSLVYGVTFRVLRDRGLCEEATQQTFLRAWQAAASFDPSRELGPWLATIARRIAIDLYRREAIRATGPLEEVAPDDPALATPPDVDAVLDVWEIRRAVSALPAQQREVVRLQHFEGLTHQEIAVRLGVPAGTVKSRSFHAHRQLALELGHLAKNPSPNRAVTNRKSQSVSDEDDSRISGPAQGQGVCVSARDRHARVDIPARSAPGGVAASPAG